MKDFSVHMPMFKACHLKIDDTLLHHQHVVAAEMLVQG